MKKNQKGIISVILVALIAAGLAGGAVYIWQQRKADMATSSSGDSRHQKKAPVSDSSISNGYLEIKELGVQFEPAKEVRDFKYVAKLNLPGSTEDGSSYQVSVAYFSTTTLEKYGSGCLAENGPAGAVARYPFDPRGRIHGNLSSPIKIGSYWYTLEMGNGGPCTDNAEGRALENSLKAAMNYSFKTLKSL